MLRCLLVLIVFLTASAESVIAWPPPLHTDPWSPKFSQLSANSYEYTSLMRSGVQGREGTFGLFLENRLYDDGVELHSGAWFQLANDFCAGVRLVGSSKDDALKKLGSTRRRGQWTGRMTDAWMTWTRECAQVEMGRSAVNRSLDDSGDLIWSKKTPSVDMIRLVLTPLDSRIELETITGKLGSTDPHGFRQRWFGLHRLQWISPRSSLKLMIGDAVVYTGDQRAWEPALANPFVPFFIAEFDGHSQSPSDSLGNDWNPDNENSLLFFQVDYRPFAHLKTGAEQSGLDLRLYCEVVIDEFQIDNSDRDRLADIGGVRLGAELLGLRNKEALWRACLDARLLGQWLYFHPGEETNWMDANSWLGNPDGSDRNRFALDLQIFPTSLWMTGTGRGVSVSEFSASVAWSSVGDIGLDRVRDFSFSSGGWWPHGDLMYQWEIFNRLVLNVSNAKKMDTTVELLASWSRRYASANRLTQTVIDRKLAILCSISFSMDNRSD
jgi:hypothetical protein